MAQPWKQLDTEALQAQGVMPIACVDECEELCIQATKLVADETIGIQKVIGFDPETCEVDLSCLSYEDCGGGGCSVIELSCSSPEEKFKGPGVYWAVAGDVTSIPNVRYRIVKNSCK